jgi:hypothetical protein
VATGKRTTGGDLVTRTGEESCPKGYLCLGGIAVACSAGSYNDDEEQVSCKTCAAGRFGSATGLLTSGCTGLCDAGYYCTASSASATQHVCGNVGFYCAAGSTIPSAVTSGHYSTPTTVDSTMRTAEMRCEAGYYCSGGEKHSCPIGHYCPAGSAGKIPCVDPSTYCPALSESPTAVTSGMYSIAEAGGERTSQEACNALSATTYYCTGGSRYLVQRKYYSMDSGQEYCPEGFYCADGAKTACDDGTECQDGSEVAIDCTDTTSYCVAGQKFGTKNGYYATPEAGSTFTGEDYCPKGHVCMEGIKRVCPAGSYCPGGTISSDVHVGSYTENPCDDPKTFCPVMSHNASVVQEGHYSSLDRASEIVCASRAEFCVEGLKHDVKPGYYAIGCTDTGTMCADNAVCPTGSYCVAGERTNCLDGMRCPTGSEESSPCGDASHYCKGGVHFTVSEGYYTTGGLLDGTTRTDQLPCACNSAGDYAAGSCGNQTVFCTLGVRYETPSGFFTVNEDTYAVELSVQLDGFTVDSFSSDAQAHLKTALGATLIDSAYSPYVALCAGSVDCVSISIVNYYRQSTSRRQLSTAAATGIIVEMAVRSVSASKDMNDEVKAAVEASAFQTNLLTNYKSALPDDIEPAAFTTSSSLGVSEVVALEGKVTSGTSYKCDSEDLCEAGLRSECPDGFACVNGKLVSCLPGEVGENGKCERCPADTFAARGSTTGNYTASECISCPKSGATCENGVLMLLENYWHEPTELINENTNFFRCKAIGTCKTEPTYAVTEGDSYSPREWQMICAEGHSGPICGTCDKGTHTFWGSVCFTCPPDYTIYLVAAAMMSFIIFIAVIAIRFGLKPTRMNKATPLTTIKSLLNYLYYVSIMSFIKVDWMNALRWLMTSAQAASGSIPPGLDCINPDIDYLQRFALYLFSPLLAFIIPLPFIAWNYICPAGHVVEKRDEIMGVKASSFYRQCVTVVLYILWPGIIRQVFEIFPCTNINGNSYLEADLSVSCDSDRYIYFRNFAYFYILGGIAYPALIMLPLWWYSHRQMLGNKEVKENWFFYYAGVKPGYWWWEIFTLFRKWTFTAIVILTAHNTRLQLYLATWALLLSFFVEERFSPYLLDQKENLDIITLGTLLVILLLGNSLEHIGDGTVDAIATNEWAGLVQAIVAILHIGLVIIFLSVLYYEIMRWGSQRQENRMCPQLESLFRKLFRPCFIHLAYVDRERKGTIDILNHQRAQAAGDEAPATSNAMVSRGLSIGSGTGATHAQVI